MREHFHLRHFFLVTILLLFSHCSDNGTTEPNINWENAVTLKIFYTNDEHGWFEGSETHNGAAGMLTMWKNDHGYSLDSENLVLSGGDMWTGPAISTWFKGQSMVEIMNEMGYDAAALGNHEFDFSQDGLRTNLELQNFPILAANVKNTVTDTYPDFIEPYMIAERSGIKIGIIGLTSSSTIEINLPDNVKNLELISHTDALNEVIPLVKNEGAEFIILLAHESYTSMISIRSLIMNHGISVVGCGHVHDRFIEDNGTFTMVQARSDMNSYAYIEVQYDTLENKLLHLDATIINNNQNYSADPDLQSTVSYWQQERDNQLAEVLGYTRTGLGENSSKIKNMIVDSWLNYFTDADIALSNDGGVRQSIPEGDITLATIVGVLPFENFITKLELTGTEVKNTYRSMDLFPGGVNVRNNYQMSDGTTLNDNSTYTVLITDYLYYTDDNLQQYDPTPGFTYINWRDPVIDWIKSVNSNPANPLENYIDGSQREYNYYEILY